MNADMAHVFNILHIMLRIDGKIDAIAFDCAADVAGYGIAITFDEEASSKRNEAWIDRHDTVTAKNTCVGTSVVGTTIVVGVVPRRTHGDDAPTGEIPTRWKLRGETFFDDLGLGGFENTRTGDFSAQFRAVGIDINPINDLFLAVHTTADGSTGAAAQLGRGFP